MTTFLTILQIPPDASGLTDQGLRFAYVLVAFLFAALIAALKWGPDAWIKLRPANGHAAHASLAAALGANTTELKVLSTQVGRLCNSYHDRLVPDLHAQALAMLRLAKLPELADLEEKRVAKLEEKEGAGADLRP